MFLVIWDGRGPEKKKSWIAIVQILIHKCPCNERWTLKSNFPSKRVSKLQVIEERKDEGQDGKLPGKAKMGGGGRCILYAGWMILKPEIGLLWRVNKWNIELDEENG